LLVGVCVCVPGTELDAQSAAMTPTGDATTTTTWTSNYYTASAAVLPAHDARELTTSSHVYSA